MIHKHVYAHIIIKKWIHSFGVHYRLVLHCKYYLWTQNTSCLYPPPKVPWHLLYTPPSPPVCTSPTLSSPPTCSPGTLTSVTTQQGWLLWKRQTEIQVNASILDVGMLSGVNVMKRQEVKDSVFHLSWIPLVDATSLRRSKSDNLLKRILTFC